MWHRQSGGVGPVSRPMMFRSIVFRLVVLTALMVGAVVVTGSVAYAQCSQAERTAGSCTDTTTQWTTDNDGDQVTIIREESNAGSEGDQSGSGTPGTSTGSSVQMGPTSPPPIRQEAELGSTECEIKVQGLCRGAAPSKNPPVEQVTNTPPTPPRYASELASFRPDRPSIVFEPNGWSVPTLPTNMIAGASRHTVRGELLGWPVEVRFQPVTYHWSFGDGASRTVSVRGDSWSSRNAPQFAATPTSHRYLRPGNYRVDLVVDYRVEFRFEGDEFDDIDGYVSATALSRNMEVLSVSPLLVK